MRTRTETRHTSRGLIGHLVPARGTVVLAVVAACALLSAGAGASPPNLTGSWQDASAPPPRPTWHLHATNDSQTLTGTWQGTLTHSGLHGAFHAAIDASGTSYSGSFHVTEASVVVDGTIAIRLVSPDKISLTLHDNNGSSSSFSLDRVGAATIHFSFRGYANDVRVVPPLVGPWQLGFARFSGSGTLGSSVSSTTYDSFEPHISRYAPAHMHAEAIGYRYTRAPHGSYSTLEMTIQITETNAKRCAPGDRGTLKLLDTTARLQNGKYGDAIGLHWLNGRCPTFEQGWINDDGGAETSPSFGGPPDGGQYAIVKISS